MFLKNYIASESRLGFKQAIKEKLDSFIKRIMVDSDTDQFVTLGQVDAVWSANARDQCACAGSVENADRHAAGPAVVGTVADHAGAQAHGH